MTTLALNNLWNYIDGLSLKKKDREWLANKLVNPTADDPKTTRQKAYVKETLTRALKEARAAQRGEIELQSLDDFIAEMKAEEKK